MGLEGFGAAKWGAIRIEGEAPKGVEPPRAVAPPGVSRAHEEPSPQTPRFRIGIDAGSKTIKVVVINAEGRTIHSLYHRHKSDILTTMADLAHEMVWKHGDITAPVSITGSAGIGVAEALGIPFVQEVVATTYAVRARHPEADCVIELGGEDAKIIYLTGGLEQRMNATCAGGTGDFIDSIAGMLKIRTRDFSKQAFRALRSYPIASRCAVFAQGDVRALMNAGASKPEIALSACKAVVKQTIGGLACGRPIKGTVVLLGGPMNYISALEREFRLALGLDRGTGIRPPNAHLYTAAGAAMAVNDAPEMSFSDLEKRLRSCTDIVDDLQHLPPLFEIEAEQEEFLARHKSAHVRRAEGACEAEELFVGFDAGSTTVKYAIVDAGGSLVTWGYEHVEGDVLRVAHKMVGRVLDTIDGEKACTMSGRIAHATVTGYGEDLLRAAFGFDSGVVETVAHLRAAREFRPDVSFVLDIGGQDMKALWVRDGVVVDAVLNEACSSGCGAFVRSNTRALEMTDHSFSHEAMRARNPIDLGAKCTVFMTSRVRHAQKVGASRGDIAAGVAYSVVNNALTRIIGADRVASMGDVIVVQGGTFKSDAVLRAFEKVTGKEVVRPHEAHLMGAYGAALIARDRYYSNSESVRGGGFVQKLGLGINDDIGDDRRSLHFAPSTNVGTIPRDEGAPSGCEEDWVEAALDSSERPAATALSRAWLVDVSAEDSGMERILRASSPSSFARLSRGEKLSESGAASTQSSFITREGLEAFDPKQRAMRCTGCGNACMLSVIEFGDGRRFVSGNRCERVHQAMFGEHPAQEAKAPNVVALEQKLVEACGDVCSEGPRGGVKVGLMNVMNAYESMPFWHELFVKLGFSVLVPDDAKAAPYADAAASTIPSESVCHPAKLAHVRYAYLAGEGATAVFMPRYERGTRCPVSAGYADALRDNVGDDLLVSPFLQSVGSRGIRRRPGDREALFQAASSLAPIDAPISRDEFDRALAAAFAAQDAFDDAIGKATAKALDWIAADESRRGAVLVGRPYHVDSALLHGIDEELCRLGFAVGPASGLSAPAREGRRALPLWKPAKHLVGIVQLAARIPRLSVVALRSFGCLYDAVAFDEARDLAERIHRPFTELKIDDVANIGHIRIRLRTLAEASVAMEAANASGDGSANAGQGRGRSETASPSHGSVTPDLCSTAKALCRRVVSEVSGHEPPYSIDVPLICVDCLTDALPFELAHANGYAPQVQVVPSVTPGSPAGGSLVRIVRAEEAMGAPEKGATLRQAAESQGKRPLIGLAGNPLLLFDEGLNDGILQLLARLGCDIAYPDPSLVEVEDVRYLPLLDAYEEAGVDHVVYLQSFGCLKGHVQSRGALHQLAGLHPGMPVTVIDYDAESSALNRENRVRLAVEAARVRLAR